MFRRHTGTVALLAVFATAVFLPGCATPRAESMVEDVNESNLDVVKQKASFQLDCPEEELDVEPISNNPEHRYDQHGSWAVRGCDKRAMYTLGEGGPKLESVDGSPKTGTETSSSADSESP